MKKLLIVMTALMFVMGFAFTASAGSYYLYADFTTGNSSFLGGYDVDSYGNYIYVNKGNKIDRYTLTTLDSDSDGTVEPDQHPSNIGPDGIPGTADDKVGPMETRTLTHDTTYSVTEIGGQSVSEIYATANGLYFLDDSSDVSYYDFSTSVVTKTTNVSSVSLSQIGRASDGTWWASNEGNQVYSYDGSTWNLEFTHTNFPGGGHLDGLELAFLDTTDDGVDNAVEYIFLSDMYADNIGRYDSSGTLLETYSYPGSGSTIVVEGMGFGANNHFWMTGSNHLYEVGGGAFAGIKPDEDPPIPEPATMLLLGSGLLGLAGFSRKKKSSKKS